MSRAAAGTLSDVAAEVHPTSGSSVARLTAAPALAKRRVDHSPVESPSATRAFVVSALEAAQDRDLVLTVAAPRVAPEALLEVLPTETATVWDPPTGPAFAGVGACRTLDLTGSERFAQLRAGADALGAVGTESLGDVEPLVPRLFGGMAFDTGAAAAPDWEGFGDGTFELPRFLYQVDDPAVSGAARSGGPTGARLAVTVRADEAADEASRHRWANALVRGLERLGELAAEAASGPGTGAEGALESGTAVAIADPEAEAIWMERVESIRQSIARGEVEKIVAARSALVHLERPLPASLVLRRLARDLRASTRFAIRRGGTTFLGVTPERLIAKRGLTVTTEALAGSIPAGQANPTLGQGAEALLLSGKDRHEHQLVVDAIVRRLEPLCGSLEVGDLRVRELRDLLHLLTPIRGVLSDDRHLVDLVESLHPTPAVGGVPTPAAMRWIRDCEPGDRGWYAAPIGWIDGSGDGELWVALRCCLLAGDRARLYTGAGIVADSDPLAELRETEWKQQALLGALGG